jgi:hypothetical protein
MSYKNEALKKTKNLLSFNFTYERVGVIKQGVFSKWLILGYITTSKTAM